VNFLTFKAAISAQFERMQAYQLYRVGISTAEQSTKDVLWDKYLSSFPEGSNPIFRERTQHDCNCCKNFIRAVGPVVAIIDSKLVSVWDVVLPDEPAYQAVADAMSKLVKAGKIEDYFLHFERKAGSEPTFEEIEGKSKKWDHFFVNIKSKFVKDGAEIPSALAGPRETKQVFLRGLTEITDDALETVMELIDTNSLLRGEEKKFAVEQFIKTKKFFNKLKTAKARELFAWQESKLLPIQVARLRNDVIGTLLQDLSEGMDLEVAVAKFEDKVNGSKYQRTTALVTPAMVKKAQAKIKELGLLSALERRYAKLSDITINNILFADRAARKSITGDVFDELAADSATIKTKTLSKVEDIPIDRFIEQWLPKAESIEILFENKHRGNLVSLTAPVDPTAGQLFKWPNNFAWSYAGEVADSIKERVKAAGGNVTGDLCCRLAWDYADDLDFHMHEPSGDHIYFGTRRRLSRGGGTLDVDANGADGPVPNPVENIYYGDRRTMKEGEYILQVNNYNRRSSGTGFEVEIDFLGTVYTFSYAKALRSDETVLIARFKYTHAKGIEIIESLPSNQRSQDAWGIKTQTFRKVNVMMLSPNHWDEKAVGNKHYFFMLDGCMNSDSTRGFYNEYLKDDLREHRKVFEILGGKMKVLPAQEQLSGLGFSSTQRNSVTARVSGKVNRTINIVF
jgi:hypothetical protein